MKAVLIRDYGGPEVLTYEDVAEPVPAAGELLVAVDACGVNPADYKFRRGDYRTTFARDLPLILGMDVSGRVIEVGDGVTGFAPGDPVMAMIPFTHTGGYAEKVAAPAEWFAPLPVDLDPSKAALLPTPGTTGVELVEDDLRVGAGTRLLVTGATGAVGLVACYAARRLGAYVIAAVRGKYRDDVRAADEVLLLDDGSPLPETSVDCIADTVGGAVANRLLDTLKAGGVLSSVSTYPVGDTRGLDVVSKRFSCYPDAKRLGSLAQAQAKGALVLPQARTMPLAEAAEAHRLMESGAVGKIVLVTARPGKI